MSGLFHRIFFGKSYRRPFPQAENPLHTRIHHYPNPLPVERDEEPPAAGGSASQQYERLRRSLFRRQTEARAWLLKRKFFRLHRAFPIGVVTAFYLAVFGGLSALLTILWMGKGTPAEAPLPIVQRPETADQAVARLYELIATRDHQLAQRMANELESQFPTDYRISAAKGTLAVSQRDLENAWIEFSKAEKLAPNSIVVVMNLAEVEFSLGRYAEAEPRYRRILAAEPGDKLVLFRLYLCARFLKRDDAEKYLRSPLIGKQSIESYYLSAADALLDGRQEEARQSLEKARLLFPGKTRVYDKTLERLGLIPILDE